MYRPRKPKNEERRTKYNIVQPIYDPLALTVLCIMLGAEAELAIEVITAPLFVLSTRGAAVGMAGGLRRFGGAAGGGLRFVGLLAALRASISVTDELDAAGRAKLNPGFVGEMPSRESARAGICT